MVSAKYRITSYIGYGAFGCVARALRKSDSAPVAIKKISLSDEQSAKDLEREVAMLTRMSHNYVLKLEEAFICPNSEEGPRALCLVTELGESNLAAYVQKREEAIPEDEALKIFVQLCLGLNFLHRNKIMHRDIKPENVIALGNGVFKLVDFGMAKQIVNSKQCHTKNKGTTIYNAPEAENGVATLKSDVFSLGLVLYFLLQGRRLAFFHDSVTQEEIAKEVD